MSEILIKATHQGDTRRLRLPAGAGYAELAAAVARLFFSSMAGCSWIDSDGDQITVATDADWAEAVQHGVVDGAIRINVALAAAVASTPAPAFPADKPPGYEEAGGAGASPTGSDSTAVAAAAAIPSPGTPKPAPGTSTFLAMLVDVSGSMSSLGGEVLSGVHSYLDGVAAADAADNTRTTVLFSTFSDAYKLRHDGVPLAAARARITAADVHPDGCTALWDGISGVLNDTEARIAALPAADKPEKVVVFILTDGHENASQLFGAAEIRQRMNALKGDPHGYEFFFAAAGQDALATGAQMGLEAGQCVTWDVGCRQSAQSTFAACSENMVKFKRSSKGTPRGLWGFSPAQRSAASPKRAPNRVKIARTPARRSGLRPKISPRKKARSNKSQSPLAAPATGSMSWFAGLLGSPWSSAPNPVP